MPERDYREIIDRRVPRFALAGVLLAAAILRFWALGHGIPYAVGVDEPEIVERALNMMRSGSLNPNGFFDYPTFSMYIQLVVYIAHFLAGAVSGSWNSLNGIAIDSFYWWGRAAFASFGIATIFLLFQAGRRWGPNQALIAAALLAVLPLHVTYSHYVLGDVPLTFFTTLTLLLALAAAERNTTVGFVVAGAAAGLAASMKYNGALAIVMPIVACAMTRPLRGSRAVRLLLIGAASLLAFLLTSPYTVLDLPGFLNGFARLAGEYRDPEAIADRIWLVYLKHLRLTFGWPALLVALAGMAIGTSAAIRGPGATRWTVVLAFTVVYFTMVARQNIVFARYLLPIVPMLCLLAAAAVVSGVGYLRRYDVPRALRTALAVGLTIAVLLPPAVQAVRFDRMVARVGTADLAYSWITSNVPKGSRVVLESRKIVFPVGMYDAKNVKTLLERDYQGYVDDSVEYVMASSQLYGAYFEAPQNFPKEYAAYMTLFTRMHEVARFTPDQRHPGAELRIFKVLP